MAVSGFSGPCFEDTCTTTVSYDGSVTIDVNLDQDRGLECVDGLGVRVKIVDGDTKAVVTAPAEDCVKLFYNQDGELYPQLTVDESTGLECLPSGLSTKILDTGQGELAAGSVGKNLLSVSSDTGELYALPDIAYVTPGALEGVWRAILDNVNGYQTPNSISTSLTNTGNVARLYWIHTRMTVHILAGDSGSVGDPWRLQGNAILKADKNFLGGGDQIDWRIDQAGRVVTPGGDQTIKTLNSGQWMIINAGQTVNFDAYWVSGDVLNFLANNGAQRGFKLISFRGIAFDYLGGTA